MCGREVQGARSDPWHCLSAEVSLPRLLRASTSDPDLSSTEASMDANRHRQGLQEERSPRSRQPPVSRQSSKPLHIAITAVHSTVCASSFSLALSYMPRNSHSRTAASRRRCTALCESSHGALILNKLSPYSSTSRYATGPVLAVHPTVTHNRPRIRRSPSYLHSTRRTRLEDKQECQPGHAPLPWHHPWRAWRLLTSTKHQ